MDTKHITNNDLILSGYLIMQHMAASLETGWFYEEYHMNLFNVLRNLQLRYNEKYLCHASAGIGVAVFR